MTLYARIKSGTVPPYLTEGKEYEVVACMNISHSPVGRIFDIVDDTGEQIECCREFCSLILSGGDWELVEGPETKE